VLALIDSEWALIFIVVAVVVLFGGSRLPKLFHSLGSAQAEYKKGLAEGHTAPAAPADQTAPAAAAPPVAAAPAAVPGSTVEAPGVATPAPAAQPAPPAAPAPGQPQPGA
jgi:TatA/E family protein of Tat protein translocase